MDACNKPSSQPLFKIFFCSSRFSSASCAAGRKSLTAYLLTASISICCSAVGSNEYMFFPFQSLLWWSSGRSLYRDHRLSEKMKFDSIWWFRHLHSPAPTNRGGVHAGASVCPELHGLTQPPGVFVSAKSPHQKFLSTSDTALANPVLLRLHL